MKFRLSLGLCAMIAVCTAIGSLLESLPLDSPAWDYASAAIAHVAGAFAGGVIARRGFVLAASLLALSMGAGLVAILAGVGGEPIDILRHPLLRTSVACAFSGAIVGAWSGQRFAAAHAATAAA